MSDEKPPLGNPAVGDPVLVLQTGHFRRSDPREVVDAVVAKVARVWIDLEQAYPATAHGLTWRMRRDTQCDGSPTGNGYRFLTPAQHAWEQRVALADAYLCSVRLLPDPGSPWRPRERRLVLANLLRGHEGLPQL